MTPMTGGGLLAGLLFLWVAAFLVAGETWVTSASEGWSRAKATLIGACLLCLVVAPVAFWRVALAAT